MNARASSTWRATARASGLAFSWLVLFLAYTAARISVPPLARRSRGAGDEVQVRPARRRQHRLHERVDAAQRSVAPAQSPAGGGQGAPARARRERRRVGRG